MLSLVVFSGTEGPLEAEQWLIQIGEIFYEARVPAEDKMSIVRIQLLDLARTWWQA